MAIVLLLPISRVLGRSPGLTCDLSLSLNSLIHLPPIQLFIPPYTLFSPSPLPIPRQSTQRSQQFLEKALDPSLLSPSFNPSIFPVGASLPGHHSHHPYTKVKNSPALQVLDPHPFPCGQADFLLSAVCASSLTACSAPSDRQSIAPTSSHSSNPSATSASLP